MKNSLMCIIKRTKKKAEEGSGNLIADDNLHEYQIVPIADESNIKKLGRYLSWSMVTLYLKPLEVRQLSH